MRKPGELGPLMRRRAALLAERGMLEAERRAEEVLVTRAKRTEKTGPILVG